MSSLHNLSLNDLKMVLNSHIVRSLCNVYKILPTFITTTLFEFTTCMLPLAAHCSHDSNPPHFGQGSSPRLIEVTTNDLQLRQESIMWEVLHQK